MDPHEFIAKWSESPKREHIDAVPHFLDLCRLLGVEDPNTADPAHDWFTFEKGVSKTSGGRGWADVWRRGCFGWEYKSHGRDLNEAHRQLLNYSAALENPPLLIVSDMDCIRIHTNWTNTVQETREFRLPDLADAAVRDVLRDCFENPERLRPAKTRQTLTEEAASNFANLAQRLRERGFEAQRVAHFVNRLVFCMFAEDVKLLPNNMFHRVLEASQTAPEEFETFARTLFEAMRTGGLVGFEKVEWFNGGLFDDADALPLDREDVREVLKAASLYWSDIDPSILGTLFERGLDPDKRSQLGAHYTDHAKIMQIVRPVIVEPLEREWSEIRPKIEVALRRAAEARERAKTIRKAAKSGVQTRKANEAEAEAEGLFIGFLERLRGFRVLDPACGSGNFLYLSLLALKDFENRVNVEGEALGFGKRFPTVGPEAVKGIELNPYAAELARVSVWIGEIQWMRRNGFDATRNPILRALDTIECRDAVLDADGSRAEWPDADVVVGNPPFLGGKLMRDGIGDAYVDRLFAAWRGRVRAEADLVLYWFAKAGEMLRQGRLSRFGLVATNSIRGGANRETLKSAVVGGRIFCAWGDEEWTVEGAAVRVSLVCVESETTASPAPVRAEGLPAVAVFSDLTADFGSGAVDLTTATRLPENKSIAFQGPVKIGSFDVEGNTARDLLTLPLNPNGRSNADVVRPILNGMDITRRPSGRWIIDFGEMPETEASLYEAPFEHVNQHVRPAREKNRRERRRVFWWQHGETVPGLKRAILGVSRAIFTPRVAKHRLYVWAPASTVPDSAVVAIVRDDDTTFGILHARFHEVWSLRMGTWLGKGNDPRYTPSTTFETFPFPEGLTPNLPAAGYAADPRAKAIAAAAADLNAKREAWLNPPDLVDRVPEVVPGYPDRIIPKDDAAAKELRKRTLTNLYNARPAWLDHAHAALDEAVADAYGWGDDWRAGRLDDEEILARLFRLNQERAAEA